MNDLIEGRHAIINLRIAEAEDLRLGWVKRLKVYEAFFQQAGQPS